ncbi:MAG: hypothetical protein R3B53_01625 [Candidatus Paceibacterota bacterium]
MIKTIQASELRSGFKSALGHVKKTKEPLVITERGCRLRSWSVLMNTKIILSARDPKFLASIKASRSEYKEGKVFSFDDVFGKV